MLNNNFGVSLASIWHFSASFGECGMKLQSFSEIFLLHLYRRRKCPSVNLTTVTVSTDTSFLQKTFFSVFFFVFFLWSLSLLSLRGCEQKAIKPLQSLVRDRYRNERWRDREDAWAATHFTLKWGNEWLSEGREERWARRGFSWEREMKDYMIYVMGRKRVWNV